MSELNHSLTASRGLVSEPIRDPVTTLFSRAFLEEYLALELWRAQRQWYPIGVVLLRALDLSAGDLAADARELLLRVAGIFLETHVRRSDVSCRYGDREFALVLPRATFETTCHRADELKRGLSELRVISRDQIIGSPEFAVGVACFPGHGITASEILSFADQAVTGNNNSN